MGIFLKLSIAGSLICLKSLNFTPSIRNRVQKYQKDKSNIVENGTVLC